MIAKDIRDLSLAELDRKLREQRDELVGLRLKQGAAQIENTSRFRQLRRDIARIETIKREKAVTAPAK